VLLDPLLLDPLPELPLLELPNPPLDPPELPEPLPLRLPPWLDPAALWDWLMFLSFSAMVFLLVGQLRKRMSHAHDCYFRLLREPRPAILEPMENRLFYRAPILQVLDYYSLE